MVKTSWVVDPKQEDMEVDISPSKNNNDIIIVAGV